MHTGIDAAYGLLALSHAVGAIGYVILYVSHASA